MMKRFLILVFLCMLCQEAYSQIVVKKPVGLDGMIQSRTSKRKHPDAKIDGYHILIYSGDNRAKAESIKSKFEAEYSQFCEVVWDEPNFKVYVGLYKTKFECMSLFNLIKNKYPMAIVIKDKIIYPPLN